MKNLTLLKITGLFSLLFLLASCGNDGKYPEIKKNPYVFTAEAQGASVPVKYIKYISPGSSDLKEVGSGGTCHLKNEWVDISFTAKGGTSNNIYIRVKENDTEDRRTVTFNTSWKGRQTKFTVIQETKN